DHWGKLAPLLLAGGGLKMGQVIGQSARNGGEPASEPGRVKNLVGTVMHSLFDVGKVRGVRGVPRELLPMSEDEASAGLGWGAGGEERVRADRGIELSG